MAGDVPAADDAASSSGGAAAPTPGGKAEQHIVVRHETEAGDGGEAGDADGSGARPPLVDIPIVHGDVFRRQQGEIRRWLVVKGCCGLTCPLIAAPLTCPHPISLRHTLRHRCHPPSSQRPL